MISRKSTVGGVFISRSTGALLMGLLSVTAVAGVVSPALGVVTIVPDNGFGTADLPPVPGTYLTPTGDMHIIDGLPPGTTIDIDATLGAFFNRLEVVGGTLGGNKQNFQGTLTMPLVGTGTLAGFSRNASLTVTAETHSAPRTLGSPVQSFNTDMFTLQGQITSDPDFDLLRVTAGTGFGLPSPGQTTLYQMGSNWAVDSFFDVTYRIDFVGAPGGHVAGMSGSTTRTVRFATEPVPEPSTLVLLIAGGIGLLAYAWRR